MNKRITTSGLIATALLAVVGCMTAGQTVPGNPEYMVVGIDDKLTWGDNAKN